MGDYDSAMMDTFCEAVRLSREYCRFVKEPDKCRELENQLTAERAKVKALENELDEWGQHKLHCNVFATGGRDYAPAICTCGLQQLKERLGK